MHIVLDKSGGEFKVMHLTADQLTWLVLVRLTQACAQNGTRSFTLLAGIYHHWYAHCKMPTVDFELSLSCGIAEQRNQDHQRCGGCTDMSGGFQPTLVLQRIANYATLH